MPKPKAGTILPTPAEDAAIISAAMSDPDAVPFTDAEWRQVKPLVRRGRPLKLCASDNSHLCSAGSLSTAIACTIASNILVEPPWIATAIATKFTK